MNAQIDAKQNRDRLNRFILLAGIIVLAFNLRPAITSVGPLFSLIQNDLGLANWSVGLLTSLPLLAFAVISPLAPTLGRKLTNERAIIVGLIILGLGIGLRGIPLVALLFTGTVLVGAGIAIFNVILPGYIKGKYPLKMALMTGVYSTVMSIFAATASGVSIPLATGLNWGWKLSMLFWLIPVGLAIMLWVYLDQQNKKNSDEVEMKFIAPSKKGQMWRSPLAWQVALFMGLQSTLFYVTISWLPEILVAIGGVSLVTAGWMLSFTQFIGLPGSLIIPIIAGKFKSQQWLVAGLGLCMLTGFTGLLLGNNMTIIIMSTAIIGFALSGNFALALTFLGLRARTGNESAELSGMAQSIGYLFAALGPVMIGLLFDLTQSWTVSLIALIAVATTMSIFGLFAARNRFVLK